MSDRVNIQDAAALERFAGRVNDFGADLRLVQSNVEADISKTLGYLSERYLLWKRRYQVYTEEAERLYAQYRRCAGNRNEDGRIPRKCQEIYEQHVEAARRRDEAKMNMDMCDSLIDNVEAARDSYRAQASKIERGVQDEGNAARGTLKTRADRARRLAAHQFSGSSLGGPREVEIFRRSADPVGGTSGPPVAQWTPGMSTDTAITTSHQHGIHETSIAEGDVKETAPDPEGAEGAIRLYGANPVEDSEREESHRPGGERM